MADDTLQRQQEQLARSIGTKMRAGRKSLRMTRKKLAALAGVSERYLNALENGDANASIAILLKVAVALNMDFIGLVNPSVAEITPVTGERPRLQELVDALTDREAHGALALLERYVTDCRRKCLGIALLGLRGAGKSTLGRRLAERHGLPFVSITREIETRAGMTLADLFNLGGPDSYRSLENEVIDELCRRDDHIVLETAGGIVGNPQALDKILGSFKTVWLKAAADEHLARVAGQGDIRPMQGNPRALDHLKTLLAVREPEYARANCTIDTAGRTIEDCYAELDMIAAPVIAPHAT